MLKRLLVIILLIFVSACSAQKTITPAPIVTEESLSIIAQKAGEKLAFDLGIRFTEVSIDNIESVDWPDACLGIVKQDEMCASVITPGYKVTLTAEGMQYVYHTNQDGSLIIAEDKNSVEVPMIDPNSPTAVNAARQFLAEILSIKPITIKVLDYSSRDWPDGCLGIAEKGISCIQVITPGYLIRLEVNGITYNLRTNLSGSLVKLDTTKPQPGSQDS
jgi:hypothetical protein